MVQKPGMLAFKCAMLLLSAALLLLGHCLGATVRGDAAAAVLASTQDETQTEEQPPTRPNGWEVSTLSTRR